MTGELILDPQIRTWVFLPMVLIAFLVGIIRHHLSNLLDINTHAEFKEIHDNHLIQRARLLCHNARYIPTTSFSMRKHAFNNHINGLLTTKQPTIIVETPTAPPLMDPRNLIETLKGNFLNVISMLLVGGWITIMFSGFLTAKVPFPLTLTFQSMLQRGIELTGLEASWVSSASWYFLNVFGLRSFYHLIFTENDLRKEVDWEDSYIGTDAMAVKKEQWEGLEMMVHEWALENVEADLIA